MFGYIRKIENFHIVLWLIKDACWIMDQKELGMLMITPILGLAFYITWKSRMIISEVCHNLAVCFWIMANSLWMTGEFFFNDSWRPYAGICFIIGLTIISYYYFIYLPFIDKQNKPNINTHE